MSRALQMLRREHRIISKLLDLFDRQVVLMKDGREPDTDLVKEIVEFFRTFPDVYHHPKEDLVVRYITRRNPRAGAHLAGLLDEHEEESVALTKLSRALTDMLMEPEERTLPFAMLAAEFIVSERRHMAWEDTNFFDTAAAVLENDDWQQIEARIARLSMARNDVQARHRFERVDSDVAEWRG